MMLSCGLAVRDSGKPASDEADDDDDQERLYGGGWSGDKLPPFCTTEGKSATTKGEW